MSSEEPPHPILADTDALLAIANGPFWELICEKIPLTTTNVCEAELKRHKRNGQQYAPDGSRPYRLYHGSSTVLNALADDEAHITSICTVPRQHGPDAGEMSLRQQMTEHPTAVDKIVVMDRGARKDIRSDIQQRTLDVQVLPPTYLYYLLYDNDLIDKAEFCKACEDMLRSEGWTGYMAVRAAWDGIPIDCSGLVDPELLPE